MKEPNVCGGQITRDMYQNPKGDWGRGGGGSDDIKDLRRFEKINQGNTDILIGCVTSHTLDVCCRYTPTHWHTRTPAMAGRAHRR